ncbi:MAG: bifunctional 3-(3-hydroxy-phenyl)propionate/3-hydroxycinnamic acid hydroxylase [Pseudomonadota bacterium]
MDTINTDILVVGAGPTGLTLANILGQGKVAAILIERKESTVGEPRAVSIDDESLRTMQAIGLAGPVLADVVTGYGVHYLTRPGGRCFAKVEPSASEFGYPRRNAFRQPLFEATLLRGLARFPSVQPLFGHTLESFSQDASGVTALVRRADGSALQIRARYMAGTDGGRSPVRDMLNIPMAGSTFKSRWLVVDTEHDDDPFWQTRVYCDARRPVVDVPGPHQTRRYEVLIHPHENADEAMSDARVAELLRPFRQGRPADIVRKVVYTFHARMAERWRAGRVFLAGDAAHLTPPYAGQGLNSGIRDAHNLGWKLVAQLDGRLSDAALDSYEAERRPHAWALIRLALNLGEVMAPRTRAHAWLAHAFFTVTGYIPALRNYFLQMKFKPKPRYRGGLLGPASGGEKHSLRGRMLPQPLVRTAQRGELLLDELIGPRFALISYHTTAASQADALAQPLADPLWRQLDAVRICILSSEAAANPAPAAAGNAIAATDIDDALRAACAGHDGPDGQLVMLLRPDRYVAGLFKASAQAAFAAAYAGQLGTTADTPRAAAVAAYT